MTNPPKKPGPRQGSSGSEADRRAARLAEALRANLRRRKAQARGRKAGDAGGERE